MQNCSFSYFDLIVLDAALNLFVSNDIEGVSKSKKKKDNAIACSVKRKLDNREVDFNAEDIRVMSASLLYFQIVISKASNFPDQDADFIKQSEKYLNTINELSDFFEYCLESAGLI